MRLTLFGCVAVVAFDATASLAAERLAFEYANLWPASLAIYGLFAFLVARRAVSVKAGLAAGALVAFADATLGWAVSWWIGPGAPDPGDNDDGASIALTVVVVVCTGAALGLCGGWLGRRSAQPRSPQLDGV
jgi:ribose/xylose/arabinose/galactoside ABC-type transport system permease subunit